MKWHQLEAKQPSLTATSTKDKKSVLWSADKCACWKDVLHCSTAVTCEHHAACFSQCHMLLAWFTHPFSEKTKRIIGEEWPDTIRDVWKPSIGSCSGNFNTCAAGGVLTCNAYFENLNDHVFSARIHHEFHHIDHCYILHFVIKNAQMVAWWRADATRSRWPVCDHCAAMKHVFFIAGAHSAEPIVFLFFFFFCWQH